MPTRQGGLPVTSKIAAPLPLSYFDEEKMFYYDQRISPLTTEGDNEDEEDETIQSLIASLTLPKASSNDGAAVSMLSKSSSGSSTSQGIYQGNYY
jgi:hypothetical protein